MRCRGADQQRLVVKADAARHCAAKVSNILRLKPQRPVLTILVVQQWQTDQIGWDPRLAIAEKGEKPGTARRYHGDAGDSVAAQPWIASEAMTDRHVHPIGDEIRQTARGGDVKLDIGVTRAEGAEPRHQP